MNDVRIVRGSPDATEVAALVAVLSGVAREGSAATPCRYWREVAVLPYVEPNVTYSGVARHDVPAGRSADRVERIGRPARPRRHVRLVA